MPNNLKRMTFSSQTHESSSTGLLPAQTVSPPYAHHTISEFASVMDNKLDNEGPAKVQITFQTLLA